MCEFLAVASFQPYRTGGEKWLPFAMFCQAVTQEGVCSNKCETKVNQRAYPLAGG